MSPIAAFMSTWSAARSSFGDGPPQDGIPFQVGSATMRGTQATLDGAGPGESWRGEAADAYRTSNVEQRDKAGRFADLDSQVADRIDRSAAVVTTGRQNLDVVKAEVERLAAMVPAGADSDAFLLSVASQGINRVNEIVAQSGTELDSIGGELDDLAQQYGELWWEPKAPETEEERKKREEEESRKKLDEILEEYQVESDTIREYEVPQWLKWAVPKEFESQSLTEGELKMLATMGPVDLYDFWQIKKEAQDEAKRRFPPPGDNDSDNHTDAFRHAYWNARMTQRFGQEWAEKYGTAHERRISEPAAREAMDLYNNEIGRRIALDHPDASPAELAQQIEQSVKRGDTVVIRTDGTGLEWSDDIPLGDDNRPSGPRCGVPTIESSPPVYDYTPYPTEGRTP